MLPPLREVTKPVFFFKNLFQIQNIHNAKQFFLKSLLIV